MYYKSPHLYDVQDNLNYLNSYSWGPARDLVVMLGPFSIVTSRCLVGPSLC